MWIAYVMQINIFLRITDKREDGYHDLASLFHVSLSKSYHKPKKSNKKQKPLGCFFQLFSVGFSFPRNSQVDLFFLLQVICLGDTIKFSLSPSKSKDRLSTNVPGVPLDERNLVRHEQTLLYLLILFFLLFIPLPCGFYVDHFSFCRLLRPLIFTGKKLALITFFG